MKHRHDVAWARLFGREKPVGWTDRTPPAPAAGTSSRPRQPHRSRRPYQPRRPLPPAAAPSHVDVAARWRDAPVNNLMVRSQLALLVSGALELPVPAEGRCAGRVFMAFP